MMPLGPDEATFFSNHFPLFAAETIPRIMLLNIESSPQETNR